VWNRFPGDIGDRIIDMALDSNDLPRRELAVRFTDTGLVCRRQLSWSVAGLISVIASDLRSAKPSNFRGRVTPTKTLVAAVSPTPINGWSVTPNARGSTVLKSIHR